MCFLLVVVGATCSVLALRWDDFALARNRVGERKDGLQVSYFEQLSMKLILNKFQFRSAFAARNVRKYLSFGFLNLAI